MLSVKVVLIFILFVLFFYSCSSQEKGKKAGWVETTGYLDPRGTLHWINYERNGVPFRARFYLKHYGASYGERFTMRFNPDNPNDVEIDYWNPIFEKGERTSFSVAKVNRIVCARFQEPKCAVDFSFEIEGEKFSKTQSLPPNFQKYYPSLKKGQYYKVEFFNENVMRCKLHLDKPVD